MTPPSSGRSAVADRRRFHLAIVSACSVVALFAVAMAWHSGDDPLWTAVNDLGQLVAAALAAASAAVTCRRTLGRERRGWCVLALGCVAWTIGQAIWTWYEVALGADVPSPGPADVGFIAAPVLWIVGVVVFVDTPAGVRSQISGVLEGLKIAGGIFLPVWALALAPVMAASQDPVSRQLVTLAYPVLDTLVLATLLFVLTRRRMQGAGSLPLVALGISAIAIADCGFWYLSTFDEYVGANLMDLGWFAGFVALALGAARPPSRRRHDDAVFHLGWQVLSLPDLIQTVGLVATVAVAFQKGTTFGTFERCLAGALVLVSLGHRLAVLSEHHSLTVGLEARVRARTRALEHRERYFAALVRSSSDIITVVDADRNIRSVSASIFDIYGWDHRLFVGQPLVASPPFGPLVDAVDAAIAEPDRVHRVEWRLLDHAGERRSAESTVSNRLADADIGCIVINTRDVTDRALLESRLRHEAFHDPLTGLPNRALFTDRVGQALRRSWVSGRRIGIAMVDLDGFKGVNDSHGHQAGDEVLRAVGEQLSSALLPGDTVARLGGDEFAILVEDIDDSVDPATIAERLLSCVHVVVDVDGVQYEVRASVGLAISERSETDPDEAVRGLLRDADIAMYTAKRDGRGSARVFRPEMQVVAQHSFELQMELRGAIERGEMVLFYQPTFTLETGAISGFEALIRWEHPTKGLISPAEFIPLAEETGLIVPLGDWVLRTAVAQLASWSRAFTDGGRTSMAVNVSVGQLRSPGLFERVRDVVEDGGIDPGRIILEVTESMLITDADSVVLVLHRLSALGVRIAIDDFGTGYASLSNLRSLPLDVLKIDRTFVSGEGRREDAALLATILDIGRMLGLQTVGEGIETPAQLEMLRAGGCDIGQGYLLARPLPADEVWELLRREADGDGHAATGVSAGAGLASG